MATDISSGGNSKFLDAKKFFYPAAKRAKDHVVVFVENEEDSIFWRNFFYKYESKRIFDIKVLRQGEKVLKGKDSLIAYVKLDSLGPNKLIAIDADYDYIIDNFHTYSMDIRDNKYVLHTCQTYAIENIFICPRNIKKAIYLSSLSENIIEDIDKLMISISNTFYDLFIIHLFSVYRKDRIFTQKTFKQCLAFLSFSKDQITDYSKKKISSQLTIYDDYLSQNHREFAKFKKDLILKGVTDDLCWQFFNGHDAFEHIGLKVALSLSQKYRGIYLHNLYASRESEKRKNNLLIEYQKRTKVDNNKYTLLDRIKQVLTDNVQIGLDWEPIKGIYRQLDLLFE